MPIAYERASFPLVGGVDTSVSGFSLPPPKLQAAENCFSEKTGALRKRKGFTSLSSLTVDNVDVGAGLAALARYKDALALLGPPATPNVWEYSQTASRWSEHGTYSPGALESLDITTAADGQSIWQTDCDATNGYRLHAQVEVRVSDGLTTIRVTLIDSFGTFICNRLSVDGFTGTAGELAGLRVVHLGTQFYVFWNRNTSRDLYVWLCDTASAATITTAIGTSGGSPASPVQVATDLHATGPAVFDAAPSGVNGIFLAYRTTTANQIKIGFVNAAGVLGSTANRTTTGNAWRVAVAVRSTSLHAVAYLNADLANDVFADLVSWSGAAWSTVSTSGAIHTLSGSIAVNIACRWDSGTTLRIWYTADNTIVGLDSARFRVYQSTYTTAGVAVDVDKRLRRSQLVSRPFLATDNNLYIWVIQGLRQSGTVQPTHYLVNSATGLPVAHANIGLAAAVATDSVNFGAITSMTESGDGAVVAPLMYLTQIRNGTASFAGGTNIGIREVGWRLEHEQSHAMVELADSLYLAGAIHQQYDGVSFVETGFLRFVETDTIARTPSPTGSMTASGQYFYRVRERRTNARGKREQGTDSGPVSVTLGAGDGRVTLDIPTVQMTFSDFSAGQLGRQDLVLAIYRTEANPASSAAPYYFVGEVPNSQNDDTVQFIDTRSDASITDEEQLDQVTVDRVAPPAAHIMCAGNGRVFLAGIEGQPHTVWFSLLRGPDEPLAFSDALTLVLPDHGGAITALAVQKEILYVWKGRALYRVRGAGPNNTLTDGSTFAEAELVSNDIGCIGQRSVVQAPLGVMFQAERGFFVLGTSEQVEYIGQPLEGLEGSQAVSATNAVTGAVLLPHEQQVRFHSSSIMWVFDYAHGIWSVYTDQGITGPSVEFDRAHYWCGTGVQREDDAAVFTAANMRFKLGWARIGPTLQEMMRVRLFGVTGSVALAASNLRVQVSRNLDPAVVLTYTESLLAEGPLMKKWRASGSARVASSLQLEFDDNGSSGVVSLNEVVLELGRRGRTQSRRVA